MIIKSVRKRDMEISLNIGNSDGSSHALEQKQCIKYLGVMIDESLTWKYHIAFVCSVCFMMMCGLRAVSLSSKTVGEIAKQVSVRA